LLKATGLLVGSAISADLGIAAMGNETAYSIRSLDKRGMGGLLIRQKLEKGLFF
jgi:hypothetical protein